MTTFEIERWGIVPGPESERPPESSLGQFELTDYPPEAVAAATLAIPGAVLVHGNDPDWWSWRARCPTGQTYVELAMTLLGGSPDDPWGGFRLSGTGSPADLLAVYTPLHAALPGAWLHNLDCEFHDADSFAEVFDLGD